MTDFSWMKLALEEGSKARIAAPPNPWVGCILVQDDKIVGRGCSAPAGGPHAETLALEQAGSKAKGATCYVTLEPCSHHGNTPPCAAALKKAGVRRIVIAIEDPDPRVAGQGIALLREAGIEVFVGCLREEAEKSLAPYLLQRRLRRPYCIAKAAISADGRIAASDGSSQWISTPEARANTHRLRAESQAILVGVGTAIADRPSLTVRHWGEKPPHAPLRVVLDPNGRLPVEGPLADPALGPTLLACGSAASAEWEQQWINTGAEVHRLEYEERKLDLPTLFSHLAERGVLQLMVEGGGQTFSSLWEADLIDALRVLIGPRLIGAEGFPLFAHSFDDSLADCPLLTLDSVEQVGQTVQLDYRHMRD
jgi:diaminohydroxyphosphoribosylaminopyrimidine deaminase/5-amino-6-(5-phosphoribosylamino)uracil reductase